MRGMRWFALWGLVACGDDDATVNASDAQTSAPSDAQTSAPSDAQTSAPVDAQTGKKDDAGSPASERYGALYSGGEFHLGPVDWDETQYHNACASEQKYGAALRKAEGSLLAGTWVGLGKPEDMCDACIVVTTAMGKTANLRVVTYGDTTRNSLDVSPEAYALLNSGEYPRSMTWQLAKCPDTGPLMYEFKSGSNQWWTAFWVRNTRVPVARVEIQSASGAFVALARDSDGSFVDADGAGAGAFAIRVTAVDQQTLTDSFTWSDAQLVGKVVNGKANFR